MTQNSDTIDLIIIDPNLKNVLGHYFEYDAAVARGAKAIGHRPLVLAHRDVEPSIAATSGAIPAFRHDIWPPPGGIGPLAAIGQNMRFLLDVVRAVRQRQLDPGAIFFVHTFISRQLLGLALLPLVLFRHHTYTFVYLLRYQPHFYRNGLSRFSFRLLEILARWRTIRFATDSERLARDFEQLTTLPVEVLPIPHVAAVPTVDPAQPAERECHFVSLGNARDEKGIFEILEAIRALAADKQFDGCRVTLQCNDAVPDVAAAIAAFRDERLPNCQLIFHKLDTPAYHDLLSRADIILFPYWRSIYSSRTSGVFMEALSAGKPVIATEDTWMSDQLRDHGAGLLCPDRDAASLARIMLIARDRLATLSTVARSRRDAWVAMHNPQALAERLWEPARITPQRRIAMCYPWSDIIEPRTGAARRCSLLAEYIGNAPVNLRVLSSGCAPVEYRGNILFESAGRPIFPARLVRLALLVVLRGIYGRPGLRVAWLLWEYLRPRVDLRLRRQLRAAVRWADVVLLEYPFCASVVVPAAHRKGRKVILTTHDILAEQMVEFPMLHRLAWHLEKSALRSADAVLVVAPQDAAVLAADGIAAVVAPNPINTCLLSAARRPATQMATDIVLPFGRFALFVGSRHGPNLAAVQVLRALAADLAARNDTADMGIVVAGTCANPQRDSRFLALGTVGDAQLMTLYRLATAAVIPLPSGTGSSVKTIEAMAVGLPVLGTSVAFRGLAVVDGENAIVENDPGRYVSRLAALLHDPQACARIGAAAQRFAEDYDYRRCFLPYRALLGLPTLLAD